MERLQPPAEQPSVFRVGVALKQIRLMLYVLLVLLDLAAELMASAKSVLMARSLQLLDHAHVQSVQ